MENFSITDFINYNIEDFKLETVNFELYNGDILKETQKEIEKAQKQMKQGTSTSNDGVEPDEYTVNEYLEELGYDERSKVEDIQYSLVTMDDAIETLGAQADKLIEEFKEKSIRIENNGDLTDSGKRKRYNSLHEQYTNDLHEISKAQGYIVKNQNELLEHLGGFIHQEVDSREFEELTVDKIMYVNGILQGDKSIETRENLARKMKHHPIALELINKNKENERDAEIVPPSKKLADEFKRSSRMKPHRTGSINTPSGRIQAKAPNTLRGFEGGIGGQVSVKE